MPTYSTDVTTTNDRLPVTAAASAEAGFVTNAAVVDLAGTVLPFQVYCQVQITSASDPNQTPKAILFDGYPSAESSPLFSGRVPLESDDQIRIVARASVVATLRVIARVERIPD